MFYDGSAFDAAPGETADDAAIAPDKQALLPGQTPSVANVTGYARGINGVMVDISNLPNVCAAVTAADFAFQAGSVGDPAAWPALGTRRL